MPIDRGVGTRSCFASAAGGLLVEKGQGEPMMRVTHATSCVLALLLASCVASWQWSWEHRIDRGSDADFRGVNALCSVIAVNDVDGVALEPVLLEQIGLRENCYPDSDRHLEVEFHCERGGCEGCDPAVAVAWARVRVVGAEVVVAESIWRNRERGLRSEEYARSFGSALRGFVLWGQEYSAIR